MCTEIFDSQKELERHILSEKHTTSAHTTSMDTIRASYVEKIKLSSQLHSSCSISNVILAEFDVSAGIKQAPLMARIVEQGWALPQRVNFRYTYEQKFLLYTIFMEGEKTGKKMSPEEVEMLIRKKLKPHQYVTSTQIRTLFSTFSRQLREGTLKPPTEKGKDRGDEGDNEETQPVVEEVNIDEVTIDEDDNIYYVDLSKEVQEVMSLVSDWDIDDYVAVRYESLWYPGKIIGVNEDDSFEISCFEYVVTFERSNKFRWPARKDIKAMIVMIFCSNLRNRNK